MILPYMLSDDVRIYYEEKGQGEPVFLLNGIFMNTASWGVISTSLSKYFKVILHDMRGQWKSDKPNEKEKYSFEAHAKDLLNLMNYLEIEKGHIVGTSYGGEVALYFAIHYPDRVKSLTIICSVSEIGLETKIAAMRWMDGILSHNPRSFVYSWINDVYSEEYLSNVGLSFIEQLVKVYSSPEFSFDSAINLMNTFFELERNPLTPSLEKINVPTLVIAAEKDRIKPPKYSELIASKIRNSELLIFSKAGHALVVEKASVLASLILGFLLRQSSK